MDEEVDVRQLYQIQNNVDYTEPNIHKELHLGNQDSVGYNSDAELYDWEIENYETQARGCWTIKKVQKKSHPTVLHSVHCVSTKFIFVGIGLIVFKILSFHGWLSWFPKFSH